MLYLNLFTSKWNKNVLYTYPIPNERQIELSTLSSWTLIRISILCAQTTDFIHPMEKYIETHTFSGKKRTEVEIQHNVFVTISSKPGKTQLFAYVHLFYIVS